MEDKIQEALSLAEVKLNGSRLELDSVKLLLLTSCLEELTGLRIPPTKITFKNFSSIESIEKTLGSLVRPPSAV